MTENVHRLDRGPSPEDECIAEMERLGLSRTAAAKRVGVSAATLSLWLRGDYTGDVAAIAAHVRRWIDTERSSAQRSLAAAGLDVHRDLAVTAEVQALLAHAQAVGDVVLIVGHSGAGKTWAARHYCQTHAAAWCLQMTPAVRSLSGLLGLVGEAVGSGGWHPSALDAQKAAVERLRDRGALLVIDEAHHLSARLLDQLRCMCMQDIAGCGLALIGDHSLTATLIRCPQITGRVGAKLEKKKPAETDVAKLLSGVLGRAATARELKAAAVAAAADGGLHALRRALARAWIAARAGGREEIAPEDVEIAAAGAAA